MLHFMLVTPYLVDEYLRENAFQKGENNMNQSPFKVHPNMSMSTTSDSSIWQLRLLTPSGY